jgi:hypothetical protein
MSHDNQPSPSDPSSPSNTRLSRIVNLFVPGERYLSETRSSVEFLGKLILEISVLSEKLVNLNSQSFYFKKGIEANIERLSSLKAQFNKLRTEVNTADTDSLLEQIQFTQGEIKKINRSSTSLIIKEIVVQSFTSKIQYLQIILGLRAELGEIKPLEYYLKLHLFL